MGRQSKYNMTISKETLQDFLNILPAVLYEYVLYKDRTSEFLFMSQTSNEILGYPPEYFVQDTNRFWEMVHPDDAARLYNEDVGANKENEFFVSEVRLLLPSGDQKWIQLSSKPTPKKKGDSVIWNGYIIDITDRKEIEVERDNLIKSLQVALKEINTLQGIIPICSYCQSIRNDEGAWDRMETYISKHTDASFSHGICPKCIGKARADLGLDNNGNKKT